MDSTLREDAERSYVGLFICWMGCKMLLRGFGGKTVRASRLPIVGVILWGEKGANFAIGRVEVCVDLSEESW